MIRIQNTDWHSHSELLSRIRYTVFVEEQQVPPALELDEYDEHADHFLVFAGNTAVATARLLDDGGVGRMAVLVEHRGQGIGLALMSHIIDRGRQLGFERLHLSAQEHALPFYGRLGFIPVGDSYQDAGIPHRTMTLALNTGPRQAVVTEHFADAAFTCACQARRRLRIFSQSLEPELYANTFLVGVISRLARRHRITGVDLLICDDQPLREGFHPLLALSQKLSSSIELRVVDPIHTSESQHFSVIADDQAIFAYGRHKDAPGWLAVNSPAQVKEPLESFQRMWPQGTTSPWLRRLP